jgi:molybdopterin converting factor subunit 1
MKKSTPAMNQIEVLFFATMRAFTGVNRITMQIPEGARVCDLKTILGEQYPDAKKALESILVAINKEYALNEDLIPEGAEVALFPHVGGG